MDIKEAIRFIEKGDWVKDQDRFLEAQDCVSQNMKEFYKIKFPEVFEELDNGTAFKIWLPMDNKYKIIAKEEIKIRKIVQL